jgi:hypothetical protein
LRGREGMVFAVADMVLHLLPQDAACGRGLKERKLKPVDAPQTTTRPGPRHN